MDKLKWISVLAVVAVAAGCGDDGAADEGASSEESTAGSTGGPGPATDSTGAEGGASTGGSSEGTTSGTTGADTTGATTGAMACVEDPQLGLGGEAIPLADFEFRNAFDPTDREIHDPEDPMAVPGPLMVDTWGDRSTGPHGTLGVFPPGFVAPLHTHTNAYDGVVLRGEMSNPFGTDLEALLDEDDTNDHGETTLTAGSFWHVPAGSHHTTTCLGPEVCWFYFHSEDLFDFAPLVDEMGALQPGVVLEDVEDSVLLPRDDLSFMGEDGSFVQFAPAWGSMADDAHGTFAIFGDGAVSPVHIHSEEYYGVVVSGTITNPFDLEENPPALTTGGYWSVPAEAVHVTACAEGSECLLYFHSRGGFDFEPLCEQPA